MDIALNIRPEGFEDEMLYRVPRAVLQRISERPHIKDFLVTDLGYFPRTEGHQVNRPNGSDSHILVFIEEGEGWLHMAGNRYTLKRGDVLHIPQGKNHDYGAALKNPWKIYWFHFRGKGAEDLLSWSKFSEKSPVLACPSIDGLRRQFRTALSAAERGYSDYSLLELSRVLINVLTQLHANTTSPVQSRLAGRIDMAMDYMREYMSTPKTLSDYARQSGLSVSGFSDAFKKHCGVSPMTYLTELRIQRACELLATTDLQINEIADRLGFNDTLYFSRLFRKNTGMPPTAFRKQTIG